MLGVRSEHPNKLFFDTQIMFFLAVCFCCFLPIIGDFLFFFVGSNLQWEIMCKDKRLHDGYLLSLRRINNCIFILWFAVFSLVFFSQFGIVSCIQAIFLKKWRRNILWNEHKHYFFSSFLNEIETQSEAICRQQQQQQNAKVNGYYRIARIAFYKQRIIIFFFSFFFL